jgi:hypothetical protein
VLVRSFAPVLRAFIASIVGIALAGFFLIPAAHEQGWVDLRAAADYPVFKIENNWLFARHSGAFWIPFDNFLHRASLIAASMIAVALLGALFLFVRYRLLAPWKSSSSSIEPKSDPFTTHWWIPLALIPAVVLVLQFPVSLPVWNLLPKLRFLQYPWRWTLIVEAPMAIFFAAAIWPSPGGARLKRNAVALTCAVFFLTATASAGIHFLRICKEGDTVSDLLEQFRSSGGLEGTDEYEPPDGDHWKIATGLPDACFSTAADTTLGISENPDATPSWRPDQGSCAITATAQLRQHNHMRVEIVAPHAGYVILRLLSFPAWRISVNGQTVQPADPRDDGLIAVPVPQGPVDLAVDWTTTPDVLAGRWVTAIGLLLAMGLVAVERVRPRHRL